MACYIERCAGGAPEQARLTVDPKDMSHSTSEHKTTDKAMRRLFARSFRNSWELISSRSQLCRATRSNQSGGGTMGSRSVPVGGAVSAASEKLIESAKLKAANLLSFIRISTEHGRFHIVGTDRSNFKEVCLSAATGGKLSFDEAETFAPRQATYPNGTHICELEIDPETGVIEFRSQW